MWIIVGLGNPGIRYRWSRHNVGFQIVDLVAKHYFIKLRKNRFIPAIIGKGMTVNKDVVLAKPTTFMNRSGLAVKGIQELYKVSVDNILVVLDDIDLPWGKIRIRAGGSSGGHRGLQSVIDNLGSTNFPRLRIGIGRGTSTDNSVTRHVLDRFNKEEKKQLEEYCNKASSAIITILNDGVNVAMNSFN